MPLYTRNGSLLTDNNTSLSTEPQCCCTGPQGATLVRAGWFHFAVLEDGVLYTYISGGVCCNAVLTGASGSWVENAPMLAPVGHPLHTPPLPAGRTVVDFECGAYHVLARLDDNTLMAWGLNHMGQCNIPAGLAPGAAPGVVHKRKSQMLSVHCGYGTSAVVFNDGTVLCWGDPDVATEVNSWVGVDSDTTTKVPGYTVGESPIMTCPVHMWDGSGEGTADVDNTEEFDASLNPGATERTAYGKQQNPRSTYNRGHDWFKRWHPGEDKGNWPAFDLGVETNMLYPFNMAPGLSCFPNAENDANCNICYGVTEPQPYINHFWDVTWTPDASPGYAAIPTFHLSKQFTDPEKVMACSGHVIIKDYAVAMLRTGQIVTTRSTNKRTGSTTKCRDCSVDNEIVVGADTYNNFGAGCYTAFEVTNPCPSVDPNDPSIPCDPPITYSFPGGIGSQAWHDFASTFQWPCIPITGYDPNLFWLANAANYSFTVVPGQPTPFECNCCANESISDPTGGGNVNIEQFQECKNCSGVTSPAEWRTFRYPHSDTCGDPYFSSHDPKAEGVGCISYLWDRLRYDPRWAKAWAFGVGALSNADNMFMYPGAQVTNHQTNGIGFPSGSPYTQIHCCIRPQWNRAKDTGSGHTGTWFNYGWDTCFTPQNELAIGGYATGRQAYCNPQLASNTECDYRFPLLADPDDGFIMLGKHRMGGIPKTSEFWYPNQMFAAHLQCGTNTSHWLTSLMQISTEVFGGDQDVPFPFCSSGWCNSSGCSGVAPQFKASNCEDEVLQKASDSPFGISACTFSPAGIYYKDSVVDEEGNHNPILDPTPCKSGLQKYELSSHIMNTRAWGPFCLTLFSGAGTSYLDQNGSVCVHNCPGCIILPPPYFPKVLGDYDAIDYSYNLTYQGVPQELNLLCRNLEVEASYTINANTIPSCVNYADAANGYQYLIGQTAQYVPNFCYKNPPISMATSRTAFMVVGSRTRQLTHVVGGVEVPTDPYDNNFQIDNCCNQASTASGIDSLGPSNNGSSVSRTGTGNGSCTACQFSTPYGNDDQDKWGCGFGNQRMLHVWGSLFDPCPPWAIYNEETETWQYPSYIFTPDYEGTIETDSSQGITAAYPPACPASTTP